MIQNIKDSIVLITSSDAENHKFGTGFVFRRSSSAVYVLTCAHVVKDLGTSEDICVDGMPATLAKSGENKGIDLAVLKVEGLWHKPLLNQKGDGERGKSVLTLGFQHHDKACLLRVLEGALGKQVELQTAKLENRIQGWDLQILDEHTLQRGYSGSPVIDKESGVVLGVVSHRQGLGESGLAISINALEEIFPTIESKQVYQLLLKLGYRQQVRQFKSLIRTHSIAAILIHGLPQSGQQWLLNRLISQHIPKIMTTRPIRMQFDSRVRKNDSHALWRELGRLLGLSKPEPDEIIRRVYKRWKTQNILIVIHDIDLLPKPREKILELIENFWTPLVKKAHKNVKGKSDYKLLMFFVDYQGKIGDLYLPFVEKLDSRWNPEWPFLSQKIEDFSEDELRDWVERENDGLPSDFKDEEVIIQEILDNSEDGIPELVLQEICERCGCDWDEELSKWWKKV